MSFVHVTRGASRSTVRRQLAQRVAIRSFLPSRAAAIRAMLGLTVTALAIVSGTRDPVVLGIAGVGIASLLVAEARWRVDLSCEIAALRASESHHRTLLASIPQRVIIKDRDLVFRSINRAVALDLGIDERDVVGMTDYDLYPADLADAYRQADREVMAKREPLSLVERNVSAAGERDVEVMKAPIVEADGSVSGVMILYEDVTDRVAAEEAQRLLSSIVESANDEIYTVGPNGNIQNWNAAAELLYGVTARAMIGRPMTAFVPADRRDEYEELLGAAMSGQRITRHETTSLTAAGSVVNVEVSASPVRARDGSIAAVSVIARDVTERRALLEQLRAAAHEDPVTGLANRALFVERLRAALDDPSTLPVSVIFLDLDDFKDVNDSYGHPVGDQLLRAVAERVRNEVRATDVVARFGGDEFAVLVLGAGLETTRGLAERICFALAKPFQVSGQPTKMGASVGVAGTSSNCGVDADELLRRADVALYVAKRSGKGVVETFLELAALPDAVRSSGRTILGAGNASPGSALGHRVDPLVAALGGDAGGRYRRSRRSRGTT